MSTLRLHDEERDEIAVLADEFLESLNGDQDPSRMSAAATGAAQRLPERLRTFLAATRTGGEAITVVSNLPVRADLEPTPLGWEPAAKLGAGWHEEGVLALVGAGLAEPFGWTSQQAGRLVHDVCPTPEDDNSLTSASSTRELNFHTEDVFHPCRSDYVALLCLRNPTRVGTTYVRAEALDLPQDVREVLFQERFLFLPDDSHNLGSLPDSAGDGSQPGAVLFGPPDAPYLRFDIDFMRPLPGDAAAAEAVETVQAVLGEHVERISLAPGDLVFVDNFRVVHGRESFRCRFDGTDRWLKRVNLTRDARRISAVTGKRTVLI
ncbi:TauD/TfdA family dioxygenase [Kitasatospora sp. NPDC057940]|uniref:TauD/TfdA family dioxygenase n=1 Tax=Kitasatospora sp. NPDC057940 TaxID=3346285 RepID=UPI0036D91AD2